KAGINVENLKRITTPKGEYLSATITSKGRTAADILAEALPKEIGSIYWPKNMYWGRPPSASCGRCAGLSRCWTAKSSRLNSTEFRPGSNPEVIASWPITRSQFLPLDQPTWPRWKKPKFSAAALAKNKFASNLMPQLEPFPARAGVKTKTC